MEKVCGKIFGYSEYWDKTGAKPVVDKVLPEPLTVAERDNLWVRFLQVHFPHETQAIEEDRKLT